LVDPDADQTWTAYAELDRIRVVRAASVTPGNLAFLFPKELFNGTFLALGEHEILIKAQDSVGVYSNDVVVTYVVKTNSPPTLALLSAHSLGTFAPAGPAADCVIHCAVNDTDTEQNWTLYACFDDEPWNAIGPVEIGTREIAVGPANFTGSRLREGKHALALMVKDSVAASSNVVSVEYEIETAASAATIGAIVGGAVGGAVVVAATVVGICFLVKRRNRETEKLESSTILNEPINYST
jgi:hypothetical protein